MFWVEALRVACLFTFHFFKEFATAVDKGETHIEQTSDEDVKMIMI